MTYHPFDERHVIDSTVSSFRFAEPNRQNSVQASKVRTRDDLMQVARLMGRVARRNGSPLDPSYIGRVLSRLHHGGGANTGFVVLAKRAGKPEGFALMLPRPGTGLELIWLYPEIGHRGDGVAEALLRQVDRILMEQTGHPPTPSIQ